MHPADINAALIKIGVRPSHLANKLKISPTSVHDVIVGRSKSRRIARAISKLTGIPLSTLWPGKYIEF